MSQRNPMNPRSQAQQRHGDGLKGAARKSAGSAKPARPAGGSVYVASSKAKSAAGKKAAKDKEKADLQMERKRERAMASTVYDLPEYKKWRRVWWVCLIVAIVAVGGSFLLSWLDRSGNLPASMDGAKGPLSTALLIIGYGALIGGLVVDFAKMRKLRKEQEAKARTMSRSQRRKLDAAIELDEKAREAARADKKKSGGLFSKRKDGAEE